MSFQPLNYVKDLSLSIWRFSKRDIKINKNDPRQNFVLTTAAEDLVYICKIQYIYYILIDCTLNDNKLIQV